MKRTISFFVAIIAILFSLFSFMGCAPEFSAEPPALFADDPPFFGETAGIPETAEPTGEAPTDEDFTDQTEPTDEDPPRVENETPREEASPPAAEAPAETPFTFSYPESPYALYEAVVATASVNVRKGAGTNYAAFSSLSEGKSLPYLWEEGGWFAVWTGERVGYLSKSYAFLSKTSRAIEKIIEAGLKKLGTPYEWGAPRVLSGDGIENPYFTGKSFDCSSFVQYCFYIGAGVKLGVYTGSQSDFTKGAKIYDYAALSRGDIYFTGANGKISHVVLYLGGRRLLQCYSANGGPVSLTKDDNWKKKFISGRRVNLTVIEQFR